ncbi:hypothetical protein BU14_0203s0018 [Porphyra umbilicalis]|uniref:Uncharacterized protein n=1 Tax=Porphyra umbilicalis TaxID=2786 RepID=A0A1X6P5V0_PORUM|nr:hypothetical protein BU14_0203s0018 [Porphyra umbilicalis]|eukprot:OSX76207.1 hypothetical protein BU14_0203s0018 [Porphyra umbilicalis]
MRGVVDHGTVVPRGVCGALGACVVGLAGQCAAPSGWWRHPLERVVAPPRGVASSAALGWSLCSICLVGGFVRL